MDTRGRTSKFTVKILGLAATPVAKRRERLEYLWPDVVRGHKRPADLAEPLGPSAEDYG